MAEPKPAASDEIVTGVFELHIFVEPLDPPPAAVEAFRQACQSAPSPMKALLLQLDYVGKGYVGVLQSSRYVEGDVASARDAARVDAEVLRAAGFTVIREKVEALVKNPGVPRDHDAATHSPHDRYFEFHLLVDSKTGTVAEDALRDLSVRFTNRLGAPVPLSYNAFKPAQRFLNLRARGVGLDAAMRPVDELAAAITAIPDLTVKKVIAEYICFDTNRAVDNGWLEPA